MTTAVLPVPNTGDAFTVRFVSTGQAVTVHPEQTVVEALAAAGIHVPVSCEQGLCGTCVLQVLEGIPDHRDMYFNDTERAANDCFTPCCSRALTPLLVVDY